MIAEREALEAAIVCLRDPLSRIQLAASQTHGTSRLGAPEHATDPAMRSIQHAVAEIDMRLEDTLTNLRRGTREASPHADLRAGVAHVTQDLKPALEARGIELIVLPLPDAPVLGDASLLRRVICRMLLGIGRWMEMERGKVTLDLEPVSGGLKVVLTATVESPHLAETRRSILGPMLGFALAEGIEVTLDENIEASCACLSARISPRTGT